jgi:hypothetical protein
MLEIMGYIVASDSRPYRKGKIGFGYLHIQWQWNGVIEIGIGIHSLNQFLAIEINHPRH